MALAVSVLSAIPLGGLLAYSAPTLQVSPAQLAGGLACQISELTGRPCSLFTDIARACQAAEEAEKKAFTTAEDRRTWIARSIDTHLATPRGIKLFRAIRGAAPELRYPALLDAAHEEGARRWGCPALRRHFEPEESGEVTSSLQSLSDGAGAR